MAAADDVLRHVTTTTSCEDFQSLLSYINIRVEQETQLCLEVAKLQLDRRLGLGNAKIEEVKDLRAEIMHASDEVTTTIVDLRLQLQHRSFDFFSPVFDTNLVNMLRQIHLAVEKLHRYRETLYSVSSAQEMLLVNCKSIRAGIIVGFIRADYAEMVEELISDFINNLRASRARITELDDLISKLDMHGRKLGEYFATFQQLDEAGRHTVAGSIAANRVHLQQTELGEEFQAVRSVVAKVRMLEREETAACIQTFNALERTGNLTPKDRDEIGDARRRINNSSSELQTATDDSRLFPRMSDWQDYASRIGNATAALQQYKSTLICADNTKKGLMSRLTLNLDKGPKVVGSGAEVIWDHDMGLQSCRDKLRDRETTYQQLDAYVCELRRVELQMSHHGMQVNEMHRQ